MRKCSIKGRPAGSHGPSITKLVYIGPWEPAGRPSTYDNNFDFVDDEKKRSIYYHGLFYYINKWIIITHHLSVTIL